MADRHTAVFEWLLGCPLIRDLFVNASQSDPEDTQLIPAETVLAEYLDGSTLRRYDVDLVRILPVSFEPNDQTNISALLDMDALAAWVDARDASGDFPSFPPGETALQITVHAAGAGFMAAQDGNRAKYVIPFSIEYLRGGNNQKCLTP